MFKASDDVNNILVIKYIYCCLELKDSKVTEALQLSADGCHDDENSDSPNRFLNEKDLTHLMEMDDYYVVVNKEFMKKIKSVPILELIEIDCKSHPNKSQSTPFYADADIASSVAELVNKCNKASSAQVNLIVSIRYFIMFLQLHICILKMLSLPIKINMFVLTNRLT